jgi:predicted Zn-dependent peptidase
MLAEGTKNYTSRRLAEEIERLGASISASASTIFALVAASALSLYNSTFCVDDGNHFHPEFPEEELNLYRQNAIVNLKYQRSQASFLANEQRRAFCTANTRMRSFRVASDIENITRENSSSSTGKFSCRTTRF